MKIFPGLRLNVPCVLGLCLLFFSTVSKSGVFDLCLSGPCNFSHPTLINVYWDSSAAQWDTDVGGTASGETVAQLDAFTLALVHSSYFSQLTQYGVNSVSVLPSITLGGCDPVPPNVDFAIANMDGVILCALTHAEVVASDQTIINVFLPPQAINTGFCNPDATGHAEAMHNSSSIFASPLYTIIPTTVACTGNAFSLMTVLTHEIVEASTDPEPGAISGWKNWGNEIGDLCENLTIFPVTPYVFGSTQQYWSNSAGACVTGFSNATPPTVTASRVCGTGREMTFVVNGTFGPTPWDLVSNQFSGQTLYLTAAVTTGTNTWTAGNFLGAPPDTVRFGNISWVPGGGAGGSDQITVSGFTGSYGMSGQIVSPGDSVVLTIENPDNGVPATAAFTAPNTSRVMLAAAPDLAAGQSGGFSATAVDGGGCAVENATLSISSPAGLLPSTATTGLSGNFFATLTYPAVAGPVTISVTAPAAASVTTRVHARLDSITPARGGVAGGQPATISGLGFDATTAILLGTNVSTISAVAADHKRVALTTPPSTITGGIGTVGISATVNGISTLGLQYDYVQPDLPVMEFVDPSGTVTAKHTCETGQIRVSAFDASGALESTDISLSATYTAFSRGLLPVSHLIVPSGTLVAIKGGGPITAVNQSVPGAVTTEGFPVWPKDLCDGIKIINARLSEIVAGTSTPYRPFVPSCNGDCGGQGVQTVVWGDAEEAPKARNLVLIQGSDAEAIAKRYEVVGVGQNAQRALLAKSSILGLRSNKAIAASFLGLMVEIKPRLASEVPATIPEHARISFSAPTTGTFAIVHLRTLGPGQAWVEETKSLTDRHGQVVTSVTDTTGIYALVETFAKGKPPQGLGDRQLGIAKKSTNTSIERH